MRKLFIFLILVFVVACSNNTSSFELVKQDYDDYYYDYLDLNFFLENHGYFGNGSYIDIKNDISIINATTHTFDLDFQRELDVIFLTDIKYDIQTIPVLKDSKCDIKCNDSICVCDLSKDYIQVNNMLFKKEDIDIAEYIKDEGMKKFVFEEEPQYRVETIDDFIVLLNNNGIEANVKEIKSDIDAALTITNAEMKQQPVALCAEIVTSNGKFIMYQIFENPYDNLANYTLVYNRYCFKNGELISYDEVGVNVDNFIIKVIEEDEDLLKLFRSMNW